MPLTDSGTWEKPAISRHGWPPPLWLGVVLLGIGATAGASHRNDLEVARRAAIVQAVTDSLAEVRREDSTRLARRLDSLPQMTASMVLRFDSTLHVVAFTILHTQLHRQAAAVRLDSASRLLRRPVVSPIALATAQRFLEMPVDSGDAKASQRQSVLRRLADNVARRSAPAKPHVTQQGGR